MRTAILADVQDITDDQMTIIQKFIKQLDLLDNELAVDTINSELFL